MTIVVMGSAYDEYSGFVGLLVIIRCETTHLLRHLKH